MEEKLQHQHIWPGQQSGALSLVGRVEILLSLVQSFIELKYFHDVATPALFCHKEPARRKNAKKPHAIKNQGGSRMIMISDHECSTLGYSHPSILVPQIKGNQEESLSKRDIDLVRGKSRGKSVQKGY